MFLFQLPDDVRLSQVCKTIDHLANRDAVWRKIEKEFVNTGMYLHILLKDRVKVSQNWSHGICRKEVMLKWRINLDGDVLYLSQAADIGVYTSLVEEGNEHDGKILVHHRRNGFSVEYSGHKQEVNCLDCIGGLKVCSSRDRTARILTLSSNCPRCTIPMNDRVWSVAISPTQRCELLCCLGSEFQRGAVVLDIVYESPFQQLTCGYDTYIRSWDLRLSPRKCVMEWDGSSYYGIIRMWDKRQTPLHVILCCEKPSVLPLIELLYAGLATALHSLDFSQGPRPHR
uniref:F-box domain-containing protein n=1 Tax=Hucho hucho TaxID=62062 RepID=A0A4W5P023_9TELE